MYLQDICKQEIMIGNAADIWSSPIKPEKRSWKLHREAKLDLQ
jgi:hypothetical protein